MTTTPLRPALGSSLEDTVEQAGALCFRQVKSGGEPEVLLISSRRTGDWGIPKGHMESGETASEGAVREAFEEAGVRGIVTRDPVGSFSYQKSGNSSIFRVRLYRIRVTTTFDDFPEKGQRILRWLPASIAANEVAHPDLRGLISIAFSVTDCHTKV